MAEDAEIKIAPLAAEHGGIDLVLIGAGDPGAMVVHTTECRQVGLKFAADPSQQLARILDDAQVRALVDGAEYLFGNEYEEALIERKSGWTQRGDTGPGQGQDHHPGPGRRADRTVGASRR